MKKEKIKFWIEKFKNENRKGKNFPNWKRKKICDWILKLQNDINRMIEKNQSLIQQYSLRNHKHMNS